eukprot:6189576-Pleurochrysis_carterae.AAC.4
MKVYIQNSAWHSVFRNDCGSDSASVSVCRQDEARVDGLLLQDAEQLNHRVHCARRQHEQLESRCVQEEWASPSRRCSEVCTVSNPYRDSCDRRFDYKG